MIDKNSSIPIYIQLEEEIKNKIKNGEYTHGEALPTERELTECYKVSRMTIRQVISNMVNKGILYRIHGKGAFVSREIIRKNLEIQSFSEDMLKRNLIPTSKVIYFDEMVPNEEIREKLNLKKDESVYYLNRIRFANKEPMAIEFCYLPKKYFTNITKFNMEKCSLYSIIKEDYSIEFYYMEQSIKAKNLSKKEAEILLGKSKGVGLVSSKLMFNIENKPIEYTETIYNSERYTFDLRIFNTKFN